LGEALPQGLEVEVALGLAQPSPERAQLIAEVPQRSSRGSVAALVLLAAAAPAGFVAAQLLVLTLDHLRDLGLVSQLGRELLARFRSFHRRGLDHAATPLHRVLG